MKPKITVLMSCYNGQRWLGEAIESVLSQTYEDFEFIIIDDGSKDDTLEIINGYAKKDSRITVIAKSNTGLSNSLNIGILKANGQWIARLDQDDLCEPRRLELQLQYVESHPDVILLGTDFIEINENDKVLKSHTNPPKHQRLVHNLLRCKRFFPHSSAFYRTEIARETGGYRQQVCHSEDHDLWLRISEHGQLACLNIPLIRLRTHPDQTRLEEGGRIAMINSHAVKACFFLRKAGCIDPLETDPDKRAEFTSWLEKRINEDGLFGRREAWSSARDTFFRSQNRLFGGLQFIGKLVTYKHLFTLMKEKFFGSGLPERLAQEWKKKACKTTTGLGGDTGIGTQLKKHINKQEAMSLDKAWQWVNDEFPFSGYIPAARKGSYYEMPKAVLKYLDKGASILDFGAGSCDKTAMLSQVGFRVTAFDDFGDNWHNFKDNREKVLGYAVRAGIEYLLPDKNGNFEFPTKHYDAIILNNVIEHLHDSPRMLLNKLLGSLKDGGFIFIVVPNAANLRKRLDLLRGRTNYPSFDSFYWSSYPWRGHIREFVKDDLIKLARFLGLEIVTITSHHYHLDAVSSLIRKIFILACKFMPSLRESWMLVGKKPAGWQQRNVPTESEAAVAFSKQYFKCNKTDIDWEAS